MQQAIAEAKQAKAEEEKDTEDLITQAFSSMKTKSKETTSIAEQI